MFTAGSRAPLLWDAHFYLAFAFFALILMHVAAALFTQSFGTMACLKPWPPCHPAMRSRQPSESPR